jgi:hypothetical protein
VFIGETGHGVTPAAEQQHGSGTIEAPYLQLVMTRLWEEERRAKSSVLRLVTLQSLGGVQSIVETHLDHTMSLLSADDRDFAARVFHYLVTPSGTKIAHSSADLAKYAAVDEAKLTPVLNRLAQPEVRVVRLVQSPRGDAAPRYEIFHDVLGAAVLDWRGRYIRWRDARHAAAVVFALIAQFVALFIPLVWFVGVAESHGAGRIVVLVFAAFSVIWWLLTSAVLIRRRRSRALRIWVVPLFGAIAMVLGPIALVVLALRRLWRWRRRRKRARRAVALGS